jgi:hypothetical protein
VYRSRDVEKGNWNCSIWTKAKDGCHIVDVHPSVVILFLDICTSDCKYYFRPSIVAQQSFRKECHAANALLNDSISSPEGIFTLTRGS